MLLVGRTWEIGSEYRFGFNGSETNIEFNGSPNYLDFGARFYNPSLGVFFSLDKFSNIYPELSPYSFCYENPILYHEIKGFGFNGGFSVENNSKQPIQLLGTGAIVTTTIINTAQGTVTGFTVEENSKSIITLEAGERFIAKTKEISKSNSNGIAIYETVYYGEIQKKVDGKWVKVKDVNVFDVDGLNLINQQEVITDEGKILTEDNATNSTTNKFRKEKLFPGIFIDTNENGKKDPNEVDRVEVKFSSEVFWNGIFGKMTIPPTPKNDEVIRVNEKGGQLTIDSSSAGGASIIFSDSN